MGKSPGKWIKTVLFGKKSSKSNISKGQEKVPNGKEVLAAASADLALNSQVASQPIPNLIDRNEGKLELEKRETANLSHDRGLLLPGRQLTDTQGSTPQDAPNDPEKIRQELAVTKAQAAFRGYLARRAFRALKGIIKLQALVRGHLVRRQAAATLCCMLGIVKLQALVRGRRVRHSDIGLEVHKKCSLGESMESKFVGSVRVIISTRILKLSANSFVCKLLTSSPPPKPLRLHYDSGEPNSVSNWLERWSTSCFWKPVPQPRKIPDSKPHRKLGNSQTVEAETGRPRRSVRRIPAGNVDSVSAQAIPEFEKPRRNLRKVSSQPVDPVQENPQNELEKVKRSLRKVHNPVIGNSVQSEVETEKPKQSLEKAPNTSVPDVLQQSTNNSGEKMKKEATLTVTKLPDVESINNSGEKMKEEATLTMSIVPDVEITAETLPINEAIDVPGIDQNAAELKLLIESSGKDENIPVKNGELSPKEDLTSNENQKSSKKSSLPAKQEHAENGLQSSPTIPSYMAATESAKAKLRAQGSPRLGQDVAEKNNFTRRHSLPSSTNSKISSQSPRTQRQVQSGSKGGNKDRSVLSSRDGNAKVTQAEWRR